MYGISSFMDRLQNLDLLDKNLGLVYNIFGFINDTGGVSVNFDRIKNMQIQFSLIKVRNVII